MQQQELDSKLVVGSLRPSAPGRECRGAPFFAPFSVFLPRFLKKGKSGRFLRCLALSKKFYTSPAALAGGCLPILHGVGGFAASS